MENYSHYQKKVLDKILPPLERIDPYEELVRLSKLYDNLLKEETDEFLLNSEILEFSVIALGILITGVLISVVSTYFALNKFIWVKSEKLY